MMRALCLFRIECLGFLQIQHPNPNHVTNACRLATLWESFSRLEYRGQKPAPTNGDGECGRVGETDRIFVIAIRHPPRIMADVWRRSNLAQRRRMTIRAATPITISQLCIICLEFSILSATLYGGLGFLVLSYSFFGNEFFIFGRCTTYYINYLGIAEIALNGIIFHVPIATKDLKCLCCDFHCGLPREILCY